MTVSIETLVKMAKEAVEIQSSFQAEKNKRLSFSGLYAFETFKACSEGLDISGLKDSLGETHWKAIKAPVCKAKGLFSYLAAGNSLVIDNEIDGSVQVTIAKVLSKGVAVSTAYTAMKKAVKVSEAALKTATDTAEEEVAAYLRGTPKPAHTGVPTNTLTATLALNGGLQKVREEGRAVMAEESAKMKEEEDANTINDAIAFLKKRGYKVTK